MIAFKTFRDWKLAVNGACPRDDPVANPPEVTLSTSGRPSTPHDVPDVTSRVVPSENSATVRNCAVPPGGIELGPTISIRMALVAGMAVSEDEGVVGVLEGVSQAPAKAIASDSDARAIVIERSPPVRSLLLKVPP
jgi:hypothetical protein